MEENFVLAQCFRGFGQWPTGSFGSHLRGSSISGWGTWDGGSIYVTVVRKHRWGTRGRWGCDPDTFFHACPQATSSPSSAAKWRTTLGDRPSGTF